MPSAGPAARLLTRLRRHRPSGVAIGIRTRLLLAFGVIVALTVLAGGVTWRLFEDVDETVNNIAGEALPAVTHAQNIAQTSSRLAAIGPALAAASSQAERADRMTGLAAQRARLNTYLQKLRNTGKQTGLVDQIAQLVKTMEDNLDRQDEAVRRRLKFQNELDKRALRANQAYAAFKKGITPAYDNAVLALYDRAEAVTEAAKQRASRFRTNLAGHLRAWRQAEAGLAAARRHLADLDPDSAQQAGERAAAALNRTAAALGRLPADLLAKQRLRIRLAAVRTAALGPGGYVERRAAGTARPARRRQLLADLDALRRDLGASLPALAQTGGNAGQVVAERIWSVVETDVERTLALLKMRIAASRMISIVNRVAGPAPRDELRQHIVNYRELQDNVYRALSVVDRFGDANRVEQALNKLTAQITGDPNARLVGEAETVPRKLEEDPTTIFGKRTAVLDATAQARELAEANRRRAQELNTLTNNLVNALQSEANQGVAQLQNALATGRAVVIAVIVASLALALAVRLYVGRRIAGRIERLARTMRQIADGHLDTEVPREGGDEISLMADQVQVFRENTRQAQEANRRIQESEERYALAIRGTSDGIWDWDRQNDRIYLSPRWKELLGFGADELSDRPSEWWERIHPDDRNAFAEHLNAHLEGTTEIFEVEHRVRCRDDSWRWMLGRGMAVFDSDNVATRVAGSLADIHERKQTEDQLRHQALYDQLTELPNRALFLDRVEMALQRSLRLKRPNCAVLFIDLDRFKILNDSLGHEAGDQLLINIAERLRACVRRTDTAARMGGDEFVVLVEGRDIEQLSQRVAERVQTALKRPMTIKGHEVYTTCSIGIALANQQSHTAPEDLLRDADAAMYEAKEAGRDRIAVFSEQVRQRALQTLEMDTALRRALENGEIVPYFQPIVDLATRRIAGFETLARWHSPERGLVSPGEFIPLAEETGLIAEIGRQLLRSSLTHLRNWQAISKELFVSVNVSPQQWLEQNFSHEIDAALKANDVDPKHLRLEVTESGMMRDYERMNASLQETGEMGMTQLLDDFGTGQSALAELLRMPLHGLKIDKSFVHTKGSEGVAQASIVRTIIALAHASDMYVVAEGIETESQAQQLATMACELGQGFYFAKPMPPHEIEDMLVEGLDDSGAAAILDPRASADQIESI